MAKADLASLAGTNDPKNIQSFYLRDSTTERLNALHRHMVKKFPKSKDTSKSKIVDNIIREYLARVDEKFDDKP